MLFLTLYDFFCIMLQLKLAKFSDYKKEVK